MGSLYQRGILNIAGWLIALASLTLPFYEAKISNGAVLFLNMSFSHKYMVRFLICCCLTLSIATIVGEAVSTLFVAAFLLFWIALKAYLGITLDGDVVSVSYGTGFYVLILGLVVACAGGWLAFQLNRNQAE